ncbi:hypothetical protein BV25DRAFT_1803341 [Artomyces pyxidatus]|uniref:Uncharacterized protein n=1 Tax=Artomyces pyxidatus TaxID=48021 RepID=A0ACB8T1S6_9AGAM|nr:hypothetical protein BV25DRAFT_1803341 [Artomyces pyxidatus]
MELDSPYSTPTPSEYSRFSPESDGEDNIGVAAGRLPEEYYTNTLPWWRAATRRKFVGIVEWESAILARWQVRTFIRTPWLDTYFVQSSMLGTHTFFMVFLPCFFFFGNDEMGRGLCYVLAFGVYSSSFMKDLICSPRPHSPPVTRLTIGAHHLEYGFPSTHSTNSMSIALFLLAHGHRMLEEGMIGFPVFVGWAAFLAFYVCSIVGGRLYTGMHGFLDCAAGVLLGAAVWGVQWTVMPLVERWLVTSGWSAPLTVTAVCLLAVNQHPQPVDDCPCFEDAIAFASVILGILVSFWSSKLIPALNAARFVSSTPGAALDTPAALLTWTSFAVLKLLTGILAIFAWRLVAKPSVQSLLPPLFRWLAHASPIRLPNRRHYTPATEYVHGPPHSLRTIPSVIDLDLSMMETVDEDAGVASGRKTRAEARAQAVKRRGAGLAQEKVVVFEEANEGGEDADVVKHYDADVLTKVVVYAGIGVIATVVMPAVFEALGWGVGSQSPTPLSPLARL